LWDADISNFGMILNKTLFIFIFALRAQPQQYWIIFSTRRDGIL
jgi:hypothetical protein